MDNHERNGYDRREAHSEYAYQRTVCRVFAEPARIFTCTNGDRIQVLAAGMINVFEGPDLRGIAILHRGVVHIGDAEVHHRATDFYAHRHDTDERYAGLLLHVVAVADTDIPQARWTLVVDPHDHGGADERRRHSAEGITDLEELQRHALLRLLRNTAEADVLVCRLGVAQAAAAMFTAWADRLHRKRRRPPPAHAGSIYMPGAQSREAFMDSAMGRLVVRFTGVEPVAVHDELRTAARHRIGAEGAAMRQEALVNVVLPMCCCQATDAQRVALLQWYWAAHAVHPYGSLRRRFAGQPQAYVWQQQGMLEYLRRTLVLATTCADVIQSYGLDSTLRFLRCVHRT